MKTSIHLPLLLCLCLKLPVLAQQDVSVSISTVSGTDFPLSVPFVDLDILFTEEVSGLELSDFNIAGSAGGAAVHVSQTGSGGDHYRLRVAGLNQVGNLTIELAAATVTGVGGGVNLASNLVELNHVPHVLQDIAHLSDEFNDSATLANWSRNDTDEGWNADKLEHWSIDQGSAGHMRLMPYSSSWFDNFTGAYAYKEIEGDFVVTMNLDAYNRAGTGRPNQDYSLAGILIRSDRGISAARPQPDPGPGVVLNWPPAGAYTTDWQPGTENFIFLSYGHASSAIVWPDGANPNRWHYEVKTTVNGDSTLYARTLGVPENEPNVTLQVVRRGDVFVLLRRHGAAGPWIVENRFVRPDFPATVQVGITTYTDWNTVAAGWNYSSVVEPFHQNRIVNVGVGTPDLIADVDWLRVRRPAPQVDAAMLQAIAVTGPSGPVVQLSATSAAPYLGDASASHVEPSLTYLQWVARSFDASELENPVLTDPWHQKAGEALPNVFRFLTDDSGADRPYLGEVLIGGSLQRRYVVPRNPLARGWNMNVQTSDNLVSWSTVASSNDGAAPVGEGLEGELEGQPHSMVVGPGSNDLVEGRQYYRLHAVELP